MILDDHSHSPSTGGATTDFEAWVDVTTDPSELHVTPGRPAAVRVRLANRSGSIDQVTVEVHGVPKSWVRHERHAVTLDPHAEAHVTVTVTVPREPTSRAGTYAVRILARSATFLTPAGHTRMTWVVAPFTRTTLEATPARARGTRRATFTLNVRNGGNIPVAYDTTVTTTDARTHVASVRGYLTAPGWGFQERVHVRFPLRWFGRVALQHVRIHVQPDHGNVEPITLTVEQRPAVPSWAIPLPAVAGLCLAWLAMTTGSHAPPPESTRSVGTPFVQPLVQRTLPPDRREPQIEATPAPTARTSIGASGTPRASKPKAANASPRTAAPLPAAERPRDRSTPRLAALPPPRRAAAAPAAPRKIIKATPTNAPQKAKPKPTATSSKKAQPTARTAKAPIAVKAVPKVTSGARVAKPAPAKATPTKATPTRATPTKAAPARAVTKPVGAATPRRTDARPRVQRFMATRAQPSDSTVRVTWDVRDAKRVLITRVGLVPGRGSRSITLRGAQFITLTAFTRDGRTVTRTVHVPAVRAKASAPPPRATPARAAAPVVAAHPNQAKAATRSTVLRRTAPQDKAIRVREARATPPRDGNTAGIAGRWLHPYGTLDLSVEDRHVTGTFTDTRTGTAGEVRGRLTPSTVGAYVLNARVRVNGDPSENLSFIVAFSTDLKSFNGPYSHRGAGERWCGWRPDDGPPGACIQ